MATSSSAQRGDDLGLSNEGLAFYDALAENKNAVDVLENNELRIITQELVDQFSYRSNIKVDWHLKESARAKQAAYSGSLDTKKVWRPA